MVNQGQNYQKEDYYDRAGNRGQGNWQNKDGVKNDYSGVYVPPVNKDTAGNGSGALGWKIC